MSAVAGTAETRLLSGSGSFPPEIWLLSSACAGPFGTEAAVGGRSRKKISHEMSATECSGNPSTTNRGVSVVGAHPPGALFRLQVPWASWEEPIEGSQGPELGQHNRVTARNLIAQDIRVTQETKAGPPRYTDDPS